MWKRVILGWMIVLTRSKTRRLLHHLCTTVTYGDGYETGFVLYWMAHVCHLLLCWYRPLREKRVFVGHSFLEVLQGLTLQSDVNCNCVNAIKFEWHVGLRRGYLNKSLQTLRQYDSKKEMPLQLFLVLGISLCRKCWWSFYFIYTIDCLWLMIVIHDGLFVWSVEFPKHYCARQSRQYQCSCCSRSQQLMDCSQETPKPGPLACWHIIYRNSLLFMGFRL